MDSFSAFRDVLRAEPKNPHSLNSSDYTQNGSNDLAALLVRGLKIGGGTSVDQCHHCSMANPGTLPKWSGSRVDNVSSAARAIAAMIKSKSPMGCVRIAG